MAPSAWFEGLRYHRVDQERNREGGCNNKACNHKSYAETGEHQACSTSMTVGLGQGVMSDPINGNCKIDSWTEHELFQWGPYRCISGFNV